jgi:hypothetical protein
MSPFRRILVLPVLLLFLLSANTGLADKQKTKFEANRYTSEVLTKFLASQISEGSKTITMHVLAERSLMTSGSFRTVYQYSSESGIQCMVVIIDIPRRGKRPSHQNKNYNCWYEAPVSS